MLLTTLWIPSFNRVLLKLISNPSNTNNLIRQFVLIHDFVWIKSIKLLALFAKPSPLCVKPFLPSSHIPRIHKTVKPVIRKNHVIQNGDIQNMTGFHNVSGQIFISFAGY